METKEKSRPAKSRAQETEKLFPEMKKSDMALIDKKIHDLLIAEGFLYITRKSQRIEGLKANNYRKLSRMEYERLGKRLKSEHERVIVITHEPGSKETA